MKRSLNRRQMRDAISAREDCVNSTGSMRGHTGPVPLPRNHCLNDVELENYLSDYHQITYVVFSYDTPIAWERTDGFKYRVQQRFSQTTSCHMGLTWRGDNE